MATNDHSEGIRLQALRVVRAYNALRNSANSANVKSDDFPIGRFAELVQQIKELGGWLELAATRGSDLHEQKTTEVREENPGADEREIKLRVAIRESMCMTRDEEQSAYERISAALTDGAA